MNILLDINISVYAYLVDCESWVVTSNEYINGGYTNVALANGQPSVCQQACEDDVVCSGYSMVYKSASDQECVLLSESDVDNGQRVTHPNSEFAVYNRTC